MSRFKQIWAPGAVAVALAVAALPSSTSAQQSGAATVAPQDSAAQDSIAKAKAKAVKDSVAKAERAQCAAANNAMNALIQKKMQEQRAQAKDSTQPKDSTQAKRKNNNGVSISLGDGDLPPGVTMQTLMRCMPGGPARRPASKPKD